MKRHDLIAQLEQAGCYLIRRGGKHDIYHNPDTGKQNQFPDIEKLMSDWLKRLSKVLQATDKFTVPIRVC